MDTGLKLRSPASLIDGEFALKPVTATQYDSLKNLPERPPNFVRDPDPIGSMISTIQAKADAKADDAVPGQPDVTGSLPDPASASEDQQ